MEFDPLCGEYRGTARHRLDQEAVVRDVGLDVDVPFVQRFPVSNRVNRVAVESSPLAANLSSLSSTVAQAVIASAAMRMVATCLAGKNISHMPAPMVPHGLSTDCADTFDAVGAVWFTSQAFTDFA